MPVALTPNEEWEYVLECDKKKDPAHQTIFILSILDHDQWVVINNQVTMGSRVSSYLCFGLIGWKNFKNGEGSDVEFKKVDGVMSPESMGRLYHDWKMELADQIRGANIVTEEEAKNSDSGDTSSPEK